MKKTITTKRCPECGNEVKNSDKYCERCGNELPEPLEQEPIRMPQYVQKERKNSWIKVSDAFFSITMIGFIATIVGVFFPVLTLNWGGNKATLNILEMGTWLSIMWLTFIAMFVIAIIGIVKLDALNGVVAFILGVILVVITICLPYIFAFSILKETGADVDDTLFSWGIVLVHESLEKKIGYYIILAGSITATVCSAIGGVIGWVVTYFI